MIAVVLEMSGIPALAFAVGVYLPLSSSTPIFVGGMVRWLVDARQRRHFLLRGVTMSEEELVAETDKSPGVLLSSGYIAGGAIAGIGIAILQGGLPAWDNAINDWAVARNPLFAGPWSDGLSLLPFAALAAYLYFVGRERAPATPRS